MKNNLLTKKALILSNIVLFFMVVVLVFMHYNIPSKIINVLNSDNSEIQTSNLSIETNTKIEFSYPLSRFDFHFKSETSHPKIIMLGNSLIRWGNWEKLLERADVINRGISGDNLAGITDRLKYLKNKNAKIWFIEGGINDIPGNTIDTLYDKYIEIIEFVKNESAIPVINLLFYLSPKAGEKFPERKDYKFINTQISKLNNMLKQYALTNNIDIIDINPIISDQSNVLLDKYSTDGLHLNDSAYTIWAIEINKILSKHKI